MWSATSTSMATTDQARTEDEAKMRMDWIRRKAKEEGNRCFRNKQYKDALVRYEEAMACDPQVDKTLRANRSATYMALQRIEEAIQDAYECVQADPNWPKGHYRLGSALAAAERWAEAQQALQRGIQLAPENPDLEKKMKQVEQKCVEEVKRRAKQMRMDRRDLALKLQEARRNDKELATLNQLKQGMASPDWDIEDHQWRPTYFPHMRKAKLDRDQFLQDPKNKVIHSYVTALADLDAPKKALPLLQDKCRVEKYDMAIRSCLQKRPGSRVLSVGAGTGILQLLAARAGAAHIYAFERSHMLFRMAKQSMAANQHLLDTSAIQLVDRPLHVCYSNRPVEASAEYGEPVQLEEEADVLITDMFDHNVLGMRVLDAVDYAAKHILRPGAIILPAKVHVKAMLVDMRIGKVSGLDLSYLNTYRWHPQHEKLHAHRESYLRISAPFDVCTIDLQTRVDALTTSGDEEDSGESMLNAEKLETLQVEAQKSGCWNAVLMWFHLELDEDSTLASWDPTTDKNNAMDDFGSSWGQAVQYIDETTVQEGDSILLQVRQDNHQIYFETDPPQAKPHHAWVPRWHFDMVLDEQRNSTYEKAVKNAIQLKRDMGQHPVQVLDVGAGSGLLSMISARAGADYVTGAEISGHMCDVGVLSEVMNGFAAKCTIVNQDSRYMDVLRKPDGTAPDMKRKADILVYEVFDSGLIGEGALHLVYQAQQKLLQENATLVPMAATVYAQPLEMRISDVSGLDFQQANRWRWRPDYEGMELERCKDAWFPLAEPSPVFDFDFYDIEGCMQNHEKRFEATMSRSGTFNAVAFWFKLYLDEETVLDTSPYGNKGATWQQAIQFFEEVRVEEGDSLWLIAKHDSYGISFEVDDSTIDRMSCRTGVPQYDPVWFQRVHRVQQLNKELMKAVAQNPKEYRSFAIAAVQMGSRPWDLDMDTDPAADFCTRFMS